MTREEQLDWLCRLRSEIYVFMPKDWIIPMNNALDMSIKDLEQEPKQGNWIVRDLPHKELLYNRTVLVCSECNFGMSQSLLGFTDYCPNCGAKMEKEKI